MFKGSITVSYTHLDVYKRQVLPKGHYATIVYKGEYEKGDTLYQELLENISESGFRIIYPVIEIYRLDIHSTSRISEFVTEIQVRVEKI